MTYQEMCSFETLYAAYLEARKRKRSKPGTAQYEANVLACTEKLSTILSTKTYVPSRFEVFYVYEPKKRLVQAPAFVDKVVLHAVVDNILYEAITKSFIRDNFASQTGKGTNDGLMRLKQHMVDYYRREKQGTDGWILKGDVHHFFASIDHDKLKRKLKALLDKRGVDPQIYDLLCVYINTTDGLPLGYQTSQLLALMFLDEFDHLMKEKYRLKYYGRYMDDFYVILSDKQRLKEILKDIRALMDGWGLGAEPEDWHLSAEERHRLPRLPFVHYRKWWHHPETSTGQHPANPCEGEVLGGSLQARRGYEGHYPPEFRSVGRTRGIRRYARAAGEIRKEGGGYHR